MLDSATIVIMLDMHEIFLKMVELRSLHYIISLKNSIQAVQWMYSRSYLEGGCHKLHSAISPSILW